MMASLKREETAVDDLKGEGGTSAVVTDERGQETKRGSGYQYSRIKQQRKLSGRYSKVV